VPRPGEDTVSREPNLPSTECSVRRADLGDPSDARAFVHLLGAYMSDPKGDMSAHTSVDPGVVDKLCAVPHAAVHFAELDGEVVGMTVCFTGFSTFRGAPLINIHDIIVLDGFRRRGVGQALMKAVEEHARALGGCKITLEVREDNGAAMRLYRRAGFGDETVPMRFWVKYL
jgi:ribosomal protein S18 acetylase RimI-like enzyme